MSKYRLPHFGELDMTDLEEYYEVEVDVEGNSVQLDLNFDEHSIEKRKLDSVLHFITDLLKFKAVADKAIRNDYESPEADTLKTYITHQLENLDEADLALLPGAADASIPREEQLLSKLYLKRVGFYPGDSEMFAVFDYTIGEELTNDLVVIDFNESGTLVRLTMES